MGYLRIVSYQLLVLFLQKRQRQFTAPPLPQPPRPSGRTEHRPVGLSLLPDRWCPTTGWSLSRQDVVEQADEGRCSAAEILGTGRRSTAKSSLF